jgi:hypothetical protein
MAPFSVRPVTIPLQFKASVFIYEIQCSQQHKSEQEKHETEALLIACVLQILFSDSDLAVPVFASAPVRVTGLRERTWSILNRISAPQ